MELVIAGHHHRTGDDLSALLARLAELRPVVVATEQQAVLFEVPAGQLGIACGTAKAVGMPLLPQRPYDVRIGQIVEAAGALLQRSRLRRCGTGVARHSIVVII